MSLTFAQMQGIALLGGEPHVFHCHHYNVFLQRTVNELLNGDGRTLQADAAEEVALPQLIALAGNERARRLADAALLFRDLGFGLLDMSALQEMGGTVTASSSHYAAGWLSKHGLQTEPKCDFVRGFIAAAAAHANGKPAGSYDVSETTCIAKGDRECTFQVQAGRNKQKLLTSVGAGQLPEAFTFADRRFGNIDEAAILAALATLPLVGNEEGAIPAFGVHLTRHYANYYNRVSYEFEKAAVAKRGPDALALVETLLVEAGHICAFNTFGGIMRSPEWEGVVKPMIRDREDWVYGITAVVNALGWGRWSVVDLVPEKRLEMVVEGSYESNGYLAMYGQTSQPKCHLVKGAVAGIMNLLYVGDVTGDDMKFTAAHYDKLFTADTSFLGMEVECRSKGDDVCRVIAEPKTF